MKLVKNPITNLANIHLGANENIDTAVGIFRKDDLAHKAAYYLDCDALRKQCDRFLNSFPGITAYAVKANCDPQILYTLWDRGIRYFDVASVEEIKLVHNLFADRPDKPVFMFHNPWKSEWEIDTAWRLYGVRYFAVNNVAEIEKIQRITGNDPEVRLSLRLNMGGSGFVSLKEGGAPVSDAARLLAAAQRGGQKFGWHFHVGAQCENTEDFTAAITGVMQVITDTGATPDYINMGGGFPAVYANNPPPLELFFEGIRKANTLNIPLICEPGRSMVASCQKSIVPVKNVDMERNTVVLCDGRFGSLAEFSIKDGRLKPGYVFVSNVPRSSTLNRFNVRGPSCNISEEALPFKLELPQDVWDGDFVIFDHVGAYNLVLQGVFNGYEPEIQFIANGYPDLY